MSNASRLVELLQEASNDHEPKAEDAELAEAAEQWLLHHGWQEHYRLGFVSETASFSADAEQQALIVRRRVHGVWEAEGKPHPVESFPFALNLIDLLGFTDERFSTRGRGALDAHARVCDEYAAVLDHTARSLGCVEDVGKPTSGWEYAIHARVWHEAAASARRLYPLRVPA